jgi:hypothetical protein
MGGADCAHNWRFCIADSGELVIGRPARIRRSARPTARSGTRPSPMGQQYGFPTQSEL